MFTSGFGEVLTDILTINPSLASIQSASAILDVSNFCIQAMTFGKDAEGFSRHSHNHGIVPPGDYTEYNDGKLIVKRYNTISPSSYHSSATHAQFSATYNSRNSYPSVYDTRLERKNTSTPLSAVLPFDNLGHYLNTAILQNDFEVYSVWTVAGGFPPSTVKSWVMYDGNNSPITSGSLSSYFNTYGIMDASGYLKFIDTDGITAYSAGWASGAKVVCTNPDDGVLNLTFCLQFGDAAALAAFGGVSQFGFYCLDIKAMLKDGLTPPYAWNHLNNIRKYKLVAKSVLWDDLLHHEDEPTLGLSGFDYLLAKGVTSLNPNNYGPAVIITIRFI